MDVPILGLILLVMIVWAMTADLMHRFGDYEQAHSFAIRPRLERNIAKLREIPGLAACCDLAAFDVVREAAMREYGVDLIDFPITNDDMNRMLDGLYGDTQISLPLTKGEFLDALNVVVRHYNSTQQKEG